MGPGRRVPGRGKTWGLKGHFDEASPRLFRSLAFSAIPQANGHSVLVGTARIDLWRARNPRNSRAAYAGYVANALRLAVGFGNLRSLQSLQKEMVWRLRAGTLGRRCPR